MFSRFLKTSAVVVLLLTLSAPLMAQTLAPELRSKIDQAANEALAKTGVPSATVAIVREGQIAYLRAYGDAKLEPKTSARPPMRYSIGSISKQFTAAAILLLQEKGKLSLDDKVAKFVPGPTRADQVTVRQLLSHTTGYQDYWPQDYVPPFMLQPITAQEIVDMWAKKPLDFEPGSKWQCSNTNYVLAGLIIEKVSGMPLLAFLNEKIFAPLGMKSVANIDQEKLGDTDPIGYMRYALGPLRPAPKEGKGWLFAAGELAMTAEDLAKWDVAMINKKILSPASYKEMQREVLLSNGVGSHYGLGVDVRSQGGHRIIEHGGEVSGFTAENTVFPDERTAVVVLTNQDAASAAGAIAQKVSTILLATTVPETPAKVAQARGILEGLQHGTIDRTLFTDDGNFYFSEQALKDFASGLAPLGTLQQFTQMNQGLRGGMVFRSFMAKFPNKTLRVWTYMMPNGKLEQYQVAVAEE